MTTLPITIAFATAPRGIEIAPSRLRRLLRPIAVPALAVALIVMGYQLFVAALTPGETIERQLTSAAATLDRIAWDAPSEKIRQAVSGHFADGVATVDLSQFPAQTAVTLHGLSRAECLDAAQVTRRIEGQVVVELEGYATAADCHERNDMTWRIMP
jgi:hypothetical protein